MKTFVSFLFLTFFIFSFQNVKSAEPKAGKDVLIANPLNDDLYVAGEKIFISAKVNGDVIAAGSEVRVTDTVMGDAILAGATIGISGFVSDDIRVAGGTIDILKGAGDDVIIFGGTVTIHDEAGIRGDVIVFGGEIEINGRILGDLSIFGGSVKLNGDVGGKLKVKGGELFLNSEVAGDSELAAEDLNLGMNAQFHGNVRYWSGDGEMDFGAAAPNAQYDPSLEIEEDMEAQGWSGAGALGFFLFSLFSSVLLIIILVFGFGKYFDRGAEIAKAELLKSFGMGVLYVISVPVLITILMITVIGIPLGILTLVFYLFTLVFAPGFASVLIGNRLRQHYHKSWNNWMIILVSTGVFIVLWLVLLIPFLGWLVGIFLVGASFGSTLMAVFRGEPKISMPRE